MCVRVRACVRAFGDSVYSIYLRLAGSVFNNSSVETGDDSRPYK